MPFTPYHFGIHATISLPFKKYIDVTAFILANVAVDIEPLIVLIFKPNYPLHGYCHTLLIGSFVGCVLALILFGMRNIINNMSTLVHLEYKPTLPKLIVSGIPGVWLHIIVDALLYSDIKPFFPLQSNPLLAILSHETIYEICRLAFIPAIILLMIVFIRNRRKQQKE